MRNPLIIFTIFYMSFSSLTMAQEEYKYQPVANKAEYYVGKLKSGKDFKDFVDWSNKLVEWTSDNPIYDNWSPNLFMPYFHSDRQNHDTVFLGIWPNATEQYAGLDYWVKNGGALLAEVPTDAVRTIDTWQWPISTPEGDHNVGAVRFADCKMAEGITSRQLFDAYKEFAMFARETGDNLGRKMIFPASGAIDGDYDYVYSLYAQNVAELGSNSDNFWENISGSDVQIALGKLIESCSNSRTYITYPMK